MDTALPEAGLRCTQCGGELHPDEGQIFLTCPYCGAAVYLDKSRVVFHWYLASTIDEDQARASLARWMAGNQTVKDLDKKARLLGGSFEYFPLWYFKYKANSGQETILVEPAAANSVSELRRINLPAGDLRAYDAALEAQSHPPSVPLQAALEWVKDRQLPAGSIEESALVHLPLYTFKYEYQGKGYTALVEGGTGGVLANIYPAKAEAPYRLAGGAAALVFLCLALFPIMGAAINSSSGAMTGLAACVVLGGLAAPVLFAFAAWVAARI